MAFFQAIFVAILSIFSIIFAAYLSVFHSLFNTLKAMKLRGYNVDLPDDVDALRSLVLEGNAKKYGARFKYSKFLKIIDQSHESISSNITTIQNEKGFKNCRKSIC